MQVLSIIVCSSSQARLSLIYLSVLIRSFTYIYLSSFSLAASDGSHCIDIWFCVCVCDWATLNGARERSFHKSSFAPVFISSLFREGQESSKLATAGVSCRSKLVLFFHSRRDSWWLNRQLQYTWPALAMSWLASLVSYGNYHGEIIGVYISIVYG